MAEMDSLELFRLLGRSFDRPESEYLRTRPHFCNAAATMEDFADYKTIVALGNQLLVARAHVAAAPL